MKMIVSSRILKFLSDLILPCSSRKEVLPVFMDVQNNFQLFFNTQLLSPSVSIDVYSFAVCGSVAMNLTVKHIKARKFALL
jgi:hypothetical protein